MTPTERRAQIVGEWRKAQGLSPAKLAALVQALLPPGAKCQRQNIEQFEAGGIARPRYLPELARVMGYSTVDDLLSLKLPPTQAVKPLSAEAMELAQLFDLLPEDERERTRALAHMLITQRLVGLPSGGAPLAQPLQAPQSTPTAAPKAPTRTAP